MARDSAKIKFFRGCKIESGMEKPVEKYPLQEQRALIACIVILLGRMAILFLEWSLAHRGYLLSSLA